ncbi:MAG: hypothetical protein H6797_00865 [Candidatus Nomurabacteria bacterium]|nr:MAG: hypothetical protein H6797_00865 [Candidatus Nomurabacteria bacterium]
MSINELLASVSNKEMDRKDFLKFSLFVIAGMVGVKNMLSLLGGVDLRPDMTLEKKPSNTGGGVGYNSGRYNR